MSKVERYIDAVREQRAIERAIEEEGETRERLGALRQAKDRALIAYGKLNGSEIGEALRTRRLQGLEPAQKPNRR